MKLSLFKNGRARWAGGGVAIALVALGVLGSAPALAGIQNTKHNLGSLGTGANKFTQTAEICVFCHTPHGADVSAAVPLWNRVLAAPTTYQTYNSLGTSSLDGASAPVGSVSLACLSCHDGGQALNVMINAPGSGLTGVALTPVAGGNMTPDFKLGVGAITNLGTDLRNDHPISIQYGGGMPGNIAYPAAPIADGAFRDKDFRGAQWSNLNGNDVWWVDTPATGVAGTREKTDMQLYTRLATGTSPVPGATGNQALVECASCHDPHSENPTFLRVANTNSAVCLACHIK
jgi:predicted CXXCH cytochrome family protein